MSGDVSSVLTPTLVQFLARPGLDVSLLLCTHLLAMVRDVHLNKMATLRRCSPNTARMNQMPAAPPSNTVLHIRLMMSPKCCGNSTIGRFIFGVLASLDVVMFNAALFRAPTAVLVLKREDICSTRRSSEVIEPRAFGTGRELDGQVVW